MIIYGIHSDHNIFPIWFRYEWNENTHIKSCLLWHCVFQKMYSEIKKSRIFSLEYPRSFMHKSTHYISFHFFHVLCILDIKFGLENIIKCQAWNLRSSVFYKWNTLANPWLKWRQMAQLTNWFCCEGMWASELLIPHKYWTLSYLNILYWQLHSLFYYANTFCTTLCSLRKLCACHQISSPLHIVSRP